MVSEIWPARQVWEFLKSEDEAGDYDALYDNAVQRAEGNGNRHAAEVLQLLDPVADNSIVRFLRPLYRGNTVTTMEALATHINRFKASSTINAAEVLRNLTENWQTVEVYFRSSTAGADEILSFIGSFVDTGRYISTLARGSTGAALSFEYRLGEARTPDVLSPEQLQENVQNAIMVTTEGNEGKHEQLASFVRSFRFAEKVHASRLALQAAGHPRYQNPAPEPIAASAQPRALQPVEPSQRNFAA